VGRKGTNSSTRTAERVRKRIECDLPAMNLRIKGYTYDQIKVELGLVSKTAARDAILRCLDDTLREPADKLRELELIRLDSYLGKVESRMDGATIQEAARLLDVALNIMTRRARLLGLDAPKQLELTPKGKIQVEYVNDWRGNSANRKGDSGENDPIA